MTTQGPGWYHAQGDPADTQRYWDGSQWVGDPQPAAGSDPAAQAAQGMSQGYAAQPAAGVAAGGATPAEFGTRFVAYLIDTVIVVGGYVAVFIISLVLGAVSNTLGSIFSLLGILGILGFGIWQHIIVQGNTGQTIGKQKQGIKLVKDATGQPVGAGGAFLRIIVGSAFGLLCGVGQLVDLAWPLFDDQKKRLTDKILDNSVVVV